MKKRVHMYVPAILVMIIFLCNCSRLNDKVKNLQPPTSDPSTTMLTSSEPNLADPLATQTVSKPSSEKDNVDLSKAIKEDFDTMTEEQLFSKIQLRYLKSLMENEGIPIFDDQTYLYPKTYPENVTITPENGSGSLEIVTNKKDNTITYTLLNFRKNNTSEKDLSITGVIVMTINAGNETISIDGSLNYSPKILVPLDAKISPAFISVTLGYTSTMTKTEKSLVVLDKQGKVLSGALNISLFKKSDATGFQEKIIRDYQNLQHLTANEKQDIQNLDFFKLE